MRSTRVPLTLLALAAPAAAQPALHSNGSASPSNPGLATGTVTASGVAAPPGFVWSEAQGAGGECNMVAGFSGHPLGAVGGAYRFADDFTVPAAGGAAGGWDLERVVLFAYQPGAEGSESPVSAVTLRIWTAAPDAPGAQVIFGDTATNRLVAAAPTNVYRVLNTAVPPLGGEPDTARLVWRLEAGVGLLSLAPGTYWLDWQFNPADPDAAVFVPPVTIPGGRSAEGWNARQLRAANPAGWTAITDPGKPIAAADLPQDLPFLLLGGGGGCAADWNHDGLVNSSDVSGFLATWITSLQGGTLEADFNGDGAVNSTDTSTFLTAWLAALQGGC